MVAYLAHLVDGYFDENTIVPNGKPGMPPLPFNEDTALSCVVLCKSEDIPSYQYNDDIRIDFYILIPISEEEVLEVKKVGIKTFVNKLERRDIADIERAKPKE